MRGVRREDADQDAPTRGTHDQPDLATCCPPQRQRHKCLPICHRRCPFWVGGATPTAPPVRRLFCPGRRSNTNSAARTAPPLDPASVGRSNPPPNGSSRPGTSHQPRGSARGWRHAGPDRVIVSLSGVPGSGKSKVVMLRDELRRQGRRTALMPGGERRRRTMRLRDRSCGGSEKTRGQPLSA